MKLSIKRPALTGMVSAFAIMIAGCSEQGSNDMATEQDNSVEAIHERVITLDTHIDIHEDMTFDPIYDPGTDTPQQVSVNTTTSA